MPAALTEFLGATSNRVTMLAPLELYYDAIFHVNVVIAGAAGATLAVQYSLDGASWQYLDGGSGPSVNVGSTGHKQSAKARISTYSKGVGTLWRVVGQNGNGVADPQFARVEAVLL